VLRHQADSRRQPNRFGDGGGKRQRDERIEPVGVAGQREVAALGIRIFRVLTIEEHDVLADPQRRNSTTLSLRSRLQNRAGTRAGADS
jgi:hypothetical protein